MRQIQSTTNKAYLEDAEYIQAFTNQYKQNDKMLRMMNVEAKNEMRDEHLTSRSFLNATYFLPNW